MSKRLRNARGRFAAARPIDVTSPSQIPMFESLVRRGPTTFVLVYADWCGHCQRYKPLWKELTMTPGRIANMAAVRDDVFKKIPTIANAEIEGFPSVIKVSPDGSIERYNVQGKSTNAIDSGKMRDMGFMRKEISTTPRTVMASKMESINTPAETPEPLNVTPSLMKNSGFKPVYSSAAPEEEDICTPVSGTGTQSLSKQPGFMRGSYNESPGSVLTSDDRRDLMMPQGGGGLSIAAAFASAVQSVGPAALLLAAHSLLPKRGQTYKSPKRSSHRGGTRRASRSRRH